MTVSEPSTASLAVAVNVAMVPEGPEASMVMLAGRVRSGGAVSWTMMLKDAEPVFPWESVALQMTVIVPRPKTLPEAGVHVGTIEPSTISVAEAEKLTVAPEGPEASTIMVAGTVTIGAVVSRTVTWKLPFTLFPRLSPAEQLTVVSPSGKVEPEAGEHSTETGPSTRSRAVALKVALAPFEPVASTIMSPERWSDGAVVS